MLPHKKKSKRNNKKFNRNNIKSKRSASFKIIIDTDLLKIKELLNSSPENINNNEKINGIEKMK